MNSLSPDSDESVSSRSHGSLISDLRLGDTSAWRNFVDLYEPLIRCWCRASGVAQERLPDIMQEVFLAAHRGIGAYRHSSRTSGLRGWLWTITRNKIRDDFRRQGREACGVGGSTAQQRFEEVPFSSEMSLVPQEEPSDVQDTTALLNRALKMIQVDFQQTTWDAFWRAVVLGQSTDQISETLQISKASVRQAKSRVLRRLRQQLGELE